MNTNTNKELIEHLIKELNNINDRLDDLHSLMQIMQVKFQCDLKDIKNRNRSVYL